MPLVFDLTPTFPDVEVPSSGSFQWGASQATFDVTAPVYFASFEQTWGNWPGSGFNYGAMVVLTSNSSTFQSGSWFGAANNWASNGSPLENHRKDQITSDSNPNSNEGVNSGDYNPFPIPEPLPEEPEKVRDATRFKKAYSFSRHQPVRIRIFR